MLDVNNDSIWNNINRLFKTEINEFDYVNWILKLDFISLENNILKLSIESDWYKEEVEKVFEKNSSLKFLIKQNFNIDYINIIVTDNKKQSISPYQNLFTIGVNLNNFFTFDNYVIGESNKLAYSAVQSIINNLQNNLYNPLFLYSEVGLGKTHLIQAMAFKLREKYKNKNIVYTTAQKFGILFVQACKNKTIDDFKNQFKDIDILIIDDIQFIDGKDKTQQEFFYTFNTLLQENKIIIMCCNKSPNNLENIDIQLKSKLNSGIVINIDKPDYEMRYNVAKSKAKLFNLQCNDEIFEYIAKNITTVTCRDIEGIIKRLSLEQQVKHIDISIKKLQEMLVIQTVSQLITIDKIQEKVSHFYKISKLDLISNKKDKIFSYPRQIAFYLSREYTNEKLIDIARKFNKNNHATVIYAIKEIKEKIIINPTLREEINTIVRNIKSS